MANSNSPKEFSLGLNRRRFLYLSGLAASAVALTGCTTPGPRFKLPSEKLNIGAIGVGGKGASDVGGCEKENIVAICDVDENTLNRSGQKYPGATKYSDYRKMLEKQKDLDAIIVSTADHHHFLASMLAVENGQHVYCQKPLTHSIWEARTLTEAARKKKVATQMGNQGRCGEGVRQVCEMIWSDAIGDIREVHSWTDRPIWPQGFGRPQGNDPAPAILDWDVWIGPAPMRPFVAKWPDSTAPDYKRGGRAIYHPFGWRGFWDFGCGALGDMGCHIMDPAVWALKLESPTSVEPVEIVGVSADMAPSASVLRYRFPTRGNLPAVSYFWYDGGKIPAKPMEMEGARLASSGTLFVGSKGKLLCDAYGGNPTLLPESRMKDYVMPAKSIPRIPNNNGYEDWIRACKGGPEACSNFNVAGPFTETVLLGNLALRLNKKIDWDSKNMRAANAPEAASMIRREYRKGWSI
ncbi:MAG: Gfo/Idh/MocA family oxidoreductase [Verrucomicrobia bacterium]|nr:Gfo/Idh/MocA family oxidoreductase [Verrucomicrobiota bacterium]